MSDDFIITTEEFDEFMSDFAQKHNTSVEYADDAGGKQVVYDIQVPNSPEEIVLRVFSSINDEDEYDESYAGQSRAKGYGSIKCTLWHTELDKPVIGRPHTKRIQTWKENLEPKLEELLQEDSYYCDSCSDGILVIRSSSYGKFKGCSNYPKCENKEDIS